MGRLNLARLERRVGGFNRFTLSPGDLEELRRGVLAALRVYGFDGEALEALRLRINRRGSGCS